MKTPICKKKILASFIDVSQRIFDPTSYSRAYAKKVIAGLRKRIITRDQGSSKEPIEYAVSILHKRTGFGRGVRFSSTYYAIDRRDTAFIKRDFGKAFRRAHPSWRIEKVTAEPTAVGSSSKRRSEIHAIVPEETAVYER